MGQYHRKFSFIKRYGHAIFPDNRKRFAPVTLTAKRSIPHFVIDFPFSDAHLLNYVQYHFHSIAHYHSVEKSAVFQNGVFGWISFVTVVILSNVIGDGNIKRSEERRVGKVY